MSAPIVVVVEFAVVGSVFSGSGAGEQFGHRLQAASVGAHGDGAPDSRGLQLPQCRMWSAVLLLSVLRRRMRTVIAKVCCSLKFS